MPCAEDTLADRRVFRLDDAARTEFAAILDRPAKRIPELAKLLNESALGQVIPQQQRPSGATDKSLSCFTVAASNLGDPGTQKLLGADVFRVQPRRGSQHCDQCQHC
ncbi:DUF1778 domain-containing protein [Mumia zhuanghuii]|uniref:DUF1778 domain-containing protein n=1 Tax=Mumia zhuanghuii TaxID=2585211 RepID=A0A5C4MP30_9ACTN|nr:DUF1778 domain-containing protein [Mumia zhuanghuii]TNC47361.1 DUF1778 domain-containing protein [Mumia zhuanghuii]TNC47660.1 DUF1778 domain-containing protein [Mumia zhuanghuii]